MSHLIVKTGHTILRQRITHLLTYDAIIKDGY